MGRFHLPDGYDTIQTENGEGVNGVRKTGIISALLAALLLAGCAGRVRIEGDPAERDGVRAVIVRYETEKKGKAVNTVMRETVRITNGSGTGVMDVKLRTVCRDRNGNELFSWNSSYNGQDTPLAPGESAEFSTGTQTKLEGKLHSVSLEIAEVSTEEEMPPVKLPKEGEYLYQALDDPYFQNMRENPPEQITVVIDRSGARTVSEFRGDLLPDALEAFLNIRIGAETQETVTDNYNGIGLRFADGTERYVSLNLYNLEISAYGRWHLYELEGLGPLLGMAAEIGVPEEYGGGS